MKLAHYDLSEPITFCENKINVLVLENGAYFRDKVYQLRAQCNGESGEWILSENGKILEISRYAELIYDPMELDLSSKRFQPRISKAAAETALSMEQETQELIQAINNYAGELLVKLDFSAEFEEVETPEPLIKLLGLKIDESSLPFPEQLTEYMLLCRKFFEKKLFIFINLKSYLTGQEFESFCKTAFYEKLFILLIENHVGGVTFPYERKRIIDKDLCEI